MAAFTKFYSFVEAIAHKKHDLETDAITLFLCNAANAPAQTDDVLADITEIAYTNVVTSGAGSRVVTQSSSAGAAGSSLYTLSLTDLVITATGGAIAAFRYVGLYNNTAANDELIGFYDYGSDVTLAEGETFTCDFAASTLTIA